MACPTPPPPPTCETDPTLCPPPPDDTAVKWKQTTNDDDCVVRVSRFTPQVRAAQIRVPLKPGEDETTYYTRLCNSALRNPPADAVGPPFDCAMYGEELAVAQSSGFSENYDLIFGNGNSRPAAYASTCTPATRSEAIPKGTPGLTYPRPVNQVRAKVHVPAAQRPDGRAVLDGVALTCEAACAPRQCCPACGPEGTPGREACDRALGPTWTGGEEHPTNPWLRFVRPGQRARVCVESVCSEWVEGR